MHTPRVGILIFPVFYFPAQLFEVLDSRVPSHYICGAAFLMAATILVVEFGVNRLIIDSKHATVNELPTPRLN